MRWCREKLKKLGKSDKQVTQAKRVVGSPTPRVEGEEKVTGQAVYSLDVSLPRMLWAKVLRSPIPYGRIKSIEIGKALELSGVKAVLTGKDAAGIRIGKRIYDMPLLADGVVRFVGEKVAAVAAETEEIAEQALELIEVEYEEWTPVLDPLEAMKPSAPLLHPDVINYRGLPSPLQSPSNVFVQLNWRKGNVEEGFQQAEVIVENTFATQPAHQAYIEPHSCLVRADDAGGAEVWASTKSPFNLREQLATIFGLSREKIVAHPCYIGGDFGGKGDHNDVALCYLLSKKAGQPVKMIMDYVEELTAGNPRHAATVRIKTGVKRDGRLVAQRIQFTFDSGAYGAFRPQGFLVGAQTVAGPYRIPNVLIEENYIYTNKTPCGYMRAPGHTQGFFANEGQMDLVAKRLGIDPVEFRKINFMRDGDVPPIGETIAHIRPQETLQRALKESGYYSAKPKGVGRGCAIAQWVSKGGESYAFVKIDQEGAVTVSSSLMDVGPGAYTIMRQVVAEELQVPLASVRIEMLDITRVPADTGVRGSTSTRVHGGAAYEAARKAKDEILKTAARLMETPPEQLRLVQGGVFHPKVKRKMSYSQIIKAKGSPIVVEGHYNNMKDGPEASMVAQVAEVEVDIETGQVKVRKFTTAHNTGTILNPLSHQGQIDGGVVMGIGYALMEELKSDDGKVLTANLGDYKIPTMGDIPELKTALIITPTGSGPYNAMSIGETPIMPVAAAIANAVEDAVGARITSLPITPEKIIAALKGR